MSKLFEAGIIKEKPQRTANALSAIVTIGARNFAIEDRQEHDFYATDPDAVRYLLQLETFNKDIWEPACGKGHISRTLEEAGYNVISSDLYNYNYGTPDVDFLKCYTKFDGDIITNPPYRQATEFAKKALSLLPEGHKLALFLKLQFLEGKERRQFFDVNPPKCIYVSSGRLRCAMNGDFEKYKNSNAICFCWYIWEKGYKGETILRWFN